MISAFSVEYTYDPAVIAKNRKQVGVNSALAVDLSGHRHISGTGGQLAHPDFREGLERQAREFNIIPKGVRLITH